MGTYLENYLKIYPNLEDALKRGARIHVFRSGSGLRVVRVEDGEKLVSYGEYPCFYGALAHAESDFGLSYEEQYSGKGAKHTHYLTGAYASSTDPCDLYIYSGKTLDIVYSEEKKEFLCISQSDDTSITGSGATILLAILACIASLIPSEKY